MGNVVSLGNTPQAADDLFILGNEDRGGTYYTAYFDVMLNDQGGNAKSLYSIDDTAAGAKAPTDLLMQDNAKVEATATDHSANGAKIWITADGKVGYNTADLSAAFLARLQGLNADQTLDDTFIYAIRLGNGTLSWATASVRYTGVNDPPALAAVAAASIMENANLSTTTDSGLTGALVGSDVDNATSTLRYDIVGGTDNGNGTVSFIGAFGTLTVDKVSGAYSFTKNAGAIEALDDGQHTQDSFTVRVTDPGGLSATQTFNVNLTGGNDVPTLDAVTSGSIQEVDQSSSTTSSGLSGTLHGHDVDAHDTRTYGITGGTDQGDGTVTKAGTYGTLTVNTASGAYTYTPNGAVEGLDQGETDHDDFTVTVKDHLGQSASQTFTVNLTGADDAPTLDAVTAGVISEDNQASTTTKSGLSGTLQGHDVDVETLTYGLVGGVSDGAGHVSVTGTYGTLTVTVGTGAYVYAPNTAAIEALDDGAHPVDSFTVTVSDGDGPAVTQTYSVTINGADDAPTLAPVTAGSVTEVTQSSTETPVGLSGTLVGHDVDAGDTLTYGLVGGVSDGAGHVSVTNTYGTLTVTVATGAYSYAPNTAAIEALDDGDHPVDSFTVTVSDGDGPAVTQAYSVTINGADDAPTLAPVTAGSVTEVDQSSTETPAGLSGTLVGHDVDAGDTLTYGLVGGISDGAGHVSVTNTYGTLTVTVGTGAYVYAPNTAAIEALDDGAHPVDSFTVTVSDGDGPAVTQTYSVTINGADDAPTLAPVTAGSVTEVTQSSTETPLNLSGTLVGHDVDAGDTLTYGLVGGVSDGAGHVSVTNTYGTLTVTVATGAYVYAPNTAAIEALDDGAHPVDSFTVTVSDGDGPAVTQTYSVTINGADDAPTLAPVTAGSVTEVTQSSTETPAGLSGTLVGHDVDAGDVLAYGIDGGTNNGDGTVSLVGTYGTLTVTVATGAYSYAPNTAAIEALDDGAHPVDSFTVTVSDGDGPAVTQTYSVTINGADDAPTLAPVTAGSVTEVTQSSTETPVGLSGTLVGHDVDAGDTLTYGLVGGVSDGAGHVTVTGTYGALTVTVATGAYVYAPNTAAIEALDDGDHPVDSFTVTVSDGDGPAVTQTYSVTINGADDAPTLAPVTAGSVTEVDQSSTETPAGLSGTLLGHDVDADDAVSYGISGGTDHGDGTVTKVGTYGTLTVHTATGDYSYAPNTAAIEALDDGAHPVDNFTVTVSDGDGPAVTQTYAVTINGADDAPTLAPVTAGSVSEVDQSSTETPAGLSGTLVGHDVDADDTVSYGISGGTDQGDGTITKVGAYGTLTVHTATGDYSYAPNTAAIEALDDGAHPVDNFTVTVSDGDGPAVTQTYAVTINGADDAPTLAAVNATIAENALASTTTTTNLTGTLSGHDVDGDSLTYGLVGGVSNDAGAHVSVTTAYGVLTVTTATGAYTFAPNAAAIEALADGAHPQVVVDTTVSDGDDGLVSSTFTLDLTGANDAPVAVADTGSAGENETKSFDVLANDTDVDTGDSKTLDSLGTVTVTSANSAVNGISAAGAFTIDNNQVKFTPGTLFDHLAEGESATVTVNYTVKDALGASSNSTLTLTVGGANDAPVLTGDLAATMNEGATYALTTADINFTDVDDSASGVAFTISDLSNGVLKVNGSAATTFTYADLSGGQVTFTHDGSETTSAGFKVVVEDGNEDASTPTASNFVITVNPVNDAPVNTIGSAFTVAEDTLVGLTGLSIADVDAGSGILTTTLTVEHGYLLINTSIPGGAAADTSVFGQIKLTGTVAQINASLADNNVKYQGAANFNGPDTFHMVTNDGGNTGLGGAQIDTDTKSITVTAVNDAPTLAAVTAGSIAEVNQSSSTTSSGLSGTLIGADVDGDTLTYGILGGTVASGVSTLAGTYGTLTVNLTSGAYTYAPNAAAIEGLDVGENPTDSFTVTVSDGVAPAATRTFAVNLTGADDAPTLAAVTSGAIAEIAGSSSTNSSGLSGSLVGSDVDTETLTYGLVGGVSDGAGHVSVATTYGTLQVTTASGAYIFTPNAAAIEGLDGGENPTLNFTFTVSDGDAPLGTTAYAINLTGADDNPTLAAVTNGSIAEVLNSTSLTTSGLTGTLSGSDVDSETLTYGIQGGTVAAGVSTKVGTYGTLTVDVASGGYTYTPNSAAIEPLNNGQTGQDNFTFTVSDGDAPLGTTNWSVNVTGADDTVAVANIKFVPVASPNDFESGLPSNDVIGTFKAFDASGNVIAGATFTTLTTNGVTLAANGTLSGSLGNNDDFHFTVATGAYNEDVHVQVGNGSDNPISGDGSLDIMFGVNGGDTLTGATNDDTLFGNQSTDTLNGGAGDDYLLGGAANDSLFGGLGNDYLRGGAGSDTFRFDTALNATSNVDEIADFNALATDKIGLSATIFTGTGAAGTTLTAANFLAVASAGDTAAAGSAHIIFDRATGNVYYDSDGGTSANRVLFAHITLVGSVATDVDNTDFQIF